MSPLEPTPEERYAAVVDAFAATPNVTPPSDDERSKQRFGANALKVDNRILAMLVATTWS